ncbi:dephospho-CoA kinase [uncultured Acinetobacter sp.]|uniref:dephospho-CoA kinase n=1 Tax=uncultured Acinetobacter sp. TaxID=165433 RepID=UPI00261B5F2B|nr:dephospho-CoA kinase [uncultured Acinetobacter sp.]
MRLIVGLTGGIGSGKSAASAWFEQQGICVVDADVVAREVVQVGSPVLQQLVASFGDWVLLENGELNRRALREHVFLDDQARHILNEITHPAIRAAIVEQLEQASSPYVMLVSPLLFESQQDELTSRSLLIDASIELQIQRASMRDGQSLEQIQNIIAAQMSREHKQQRADDIVLNDGELEHLYAQLRPLHLNYLALSEQ